MAAITTIAAVVGAAAAVGGAYMSIEARSDARKAQGRSRQAQLRAQAEQRAANASEAAKERRQQIREERIRRARILQSSENTGVAGSSGEFGALGSLATQLNANLGDSAGRRQRADNMSLFGQQQADANADINSALNDQQVGQSIFSMGGTLFNAAGGIGTIKDSSIFQSTDPLGDFITKNKIGQ